MRVNSYRWGLLLLLLLLQSLVRLDIATAHNIGVSQREQDSRYWPENNHWCSSISTADLGFTDTAQQLN